MLWGTHDVHSDPGVRTVFRRIECSKAKAHTKNIPKRTVNLLLGQQAPLHGKRKILLKLRIVRIISSLDRHSCCVDRIFAEALSYLCATCGGQQLHCTQIIRYEAIKMPSPSEYVCEQIVIDGIRHPVDRVVARHHRLRM